jgi:hypothetical protein
LKLDAALNAMAAQVYDNLYEQLQQIQNKALEDSKVTAEALQSKLKHPTQLKSYCDQVSVKSKVFYID